MLGLHTLIDQLQFLVHIRQAKLNAGVVDGFNKINCLCDPRASTGAKS